LPGDWRERTLAMIRGAEPLAGDWFSGGPVCTPLDQIAIYADQYRMRLGDAVRSEIPGLVHLMGEATDDQLRRYVAACPSRTWTLHRVAERLAGWLAEQGAPRAWVEMAELDRAVQRGFEAADLPPVTPERLAVEPTLVLQPHVTLLRLSWNVHEVRSAVLSQKEAPELREGHFPVVVFRRGTRMRHWEVPIGLFALLDAIGEGSSVALAIDAAFRSGRVDLPTLQREIGGWFREMATRSLVSASPPQQ
jgi:hypothetical protein